MAKEKMIKRGFQKIEVTAAVVEVVKGEIKTTNLEPIVFFDEKVTKETVIKKLKDMNGAEYDYIILDQKEETIYYEMSVSKFIENAIIIQPNVKDSAVII